MALDQSALLDLLAELKLTDVPDRIRVSTEALYLQLIDAEASAFIGAVPFERNTTRTTHRNGSRPRTLSTTAGDVDSVLGRDPAQPIGVEFAGQLGEPTTAPR